MQRVIHFHDVPLDPDRLAGGDNRVKIKHALTHFGERPFGVSRHVLEMEQPATVAQRADESGWIDAGVLRPVDIDLQADEIWVSRFEQQLEARASIELLELEVVMVVEEGQPISLRDGSGMGEDPRDGAVRIRVATPLLGKIGTANESATKLVRVGNCPLDIGLQSFQGNMA